MPSERRAVLKEHDPEWYPLVLSKPPSPDVVKLFRAALGLLLKKVRSLPSPGTRQPRHMLSCVPFVPAVVMTCAAFDERCCARSA